MSEAMNTTNRNLRRRTTLSAFALAALGAVSVGAVSLGVVGCAGDPAVGGEGSPLLGPAAIPLPEAPSGALDMAPPDCAGRLTNVGASHLRFTVASLSAGLVAVVDGSGSVICVDSVSDVQSDLDSTGQTDEAAAVVAGFTAAAHQADGRDARFSGRALPGDPEPQPNIQPTKLPDPEPQPN
jgi:hypothetical protein